MGKKEGRDIFVKSHTGKINQRLIKMRGKENTFEGMGLRQQWILTFETYRCFTIFIKIKQKSIKFKTSEPHRENNRFN